MATKRLHRIHPTVYAAGHSLLQLHGRYMAAVLACGDGAVLSHRDAATLLDLLPVGSGAIQVTTPRRGTAALRRLLAEIGDDPPFIRSELERRLLELIREAGLPLPVVNGRIAGLEVDFHWPGRPLVVDTDGRATHGHALAFHTDDLDLDLELAGRHVVRITWRQTVNEPQRVVAALRSRLG